jgi:nucleotide-binding universal stress UspA family protein
MPFRRILCAVDFSPDSVSAFRVAVDLARLHPASLHVLHVIEAEPVAVLPIQGAGELMVRIVAQANAAMEKLVASEPSPGASSLTCEVITGRGFVEIVDRAHAWGADLIVLGAKGTVSLERLVVGSTAERVTRSAACSVLVVRPRRRAPAEHEDGGG